MTKEATMEMMKRCLSMGFLLVGGVQEFGQPERWSMSMRIILEMPEVRKIGRQRLLHSEVVS
jgi:hypothetical protein